MKTNGITVLLAEVNPSIFTLPAVGEVVTYADLKVQVKVESNEEPFGRVLVSGQGIRCADVRLALQRLLQSGVSDRARQRAFAVNGENFWHSV